MAQLSSKPLDHSKEEIRLLRVDLADDHEKRFHKLISNVPFKSQSAKYVALSYVYSADSAQVNVDGNLVQVSTNLTKAVDEVITYWTRKDARKNQAGELYLWIDQLCINQKDSIEKSYQASMMGEIYMHADEVLIWLPIPGEIRGPFNTWDDWKSWHQQQVDLMLAGKLPREDEMVYTNTSGASGRGSGEYPIVSGDDRHDRNLMLAWTRIHSILCSSWWGRAWAFQEFLGADKTIFLAQGLSMPWRELAELLGMFFNVRKEHADLWSRKEDTLKEQAVREENTKTKSPGFFDQCCGSADEAAGAQEINMSERKTREQQMAYLQNYNKQYAQGDESWHLVNHMLNTKTKRSKANSEQYELLSDLLNNGRVRHSSDPRDKVYAFLGLATSSYGITPDYNSSVNAVLIETARAIITQERRLDILAIARENARPAQGSESLPSWVPDWSDREHWNAEYRKFLREVRFPTSTCRASQDRKAEAGFQNRFLEIQGIRADKLSEKVEDPPYRPYRRFKTEAGRDVTTVNSAKVGDEIWVFLGANEPYVIRKGGSYYIILGHAMIYEAKMPSPILDGALIDQLAGGAVSLESIQIT